jgi:hypothetical protein
VTRRLAALATLVALGFLATACAPRPSDDALRQSFIAHRSEFNALVAMILYDKSLNRVDEDWTAPADVASIGLDAARIADYRRRLVAVGCPRGFSYDPKSGPINFVAWSTGFVTGGASKYIAFRPAPPTQLVDNLDSYHATSRGAIDVYRSLDDSWYLELRER